MSLNASFLTYLNQVSQLRGARRIQQQRQRVLKQTIKNKMTSDEELMVLYQKSEGQAFETIYQRYGGRILAYMRKRTGSDRSAQDLTQEVFLKLHRSRSQYDKTLPLAPWIFSISRSVFLDFAKKKSLEDATSPEQLDRFSSPSSGENAEADLTRSSEIFEVLSEIQKQVVSLRVFDEATFDEIARRLSTSPENARQIFSRGVRRLKSKLTGTEM